MGFGLLGFKIGGRKSDGHTLDGMAICADGFRRQGGPARSEGTAMPTKRARVRFPVLAAFGDERAAFLDNEQAAAATRDDRIRSVWAFVIRQASAFHKSLQVRERANFDLDDVLLDL